MRRFVKNLGIIIIILSGASLVFFMQKDFASNLALGSSVGGVIFGMLLHIILNRVMEDI